VVFSSIACWSLYLPYPVVVVVVVVVTEVVVVAVLVVLVTVGAALAVKCIMKMILLLLLLLLLLPSVPVSYQPETRKALQKNSSIIIYFIDLRAFEQHQKN